MCARIVLLGICPDWCHVFTGAFTIAIPLMEEHIRFRYGIVRGDRICGNVATLFMLPQVCNNGVITRVEENMKQLDKVLHEARLQVCWGSCGGLCCLACCNMHMNTQGLRVVFTFGNNWYAGWNCVAWCILVIWLSSLICQPFISTQA